VVLSQREQENRKGRKVKRQILEIEPHPSDCCPGHDKWPNETYRNRRSKKARSRDKKKEHRYVRRMSKKKIQE